MTGNVLRDYNTDMFPITELGTSAKMLSIVPLLKGGGMYETGAGGSAPKHVQQFLQEGHLRWDSLGEYLAMAVCLEDLAAKPGHDQARLATLAKTLNVAIGKWLDNNKSPGRKVKEIDNRLSHFYIALYWAEALATEDSRDFAQLHSQLSSATTAVTREMTDCQGPAVDVGGYYRPDLAKAGVAMRPSATFNAIIGGAGSGKL